MDEIKKAPLGGSEKSHYKGKQFLVNMPKKLGLKPNKRYIFTESEKGYHMNYGSSWIGMPKPLIEENPQLYSLIKKGGDNE